MATARAVFACLLAIASATPASADEAPSRLATLLGSDADPGFARALEPREFVFPDDHGPHPEFRNEWWYVTGNVHDERGRHFGFELTFFRFSLRPEPVESGSAWRTNQVYIAHLAVTDTASDEFHVGERYSRGAVGLAGARAAPFRVWIDNWRFAQSANAGAWQLQAADDDFGIDLELRALKAPVLNGIDGLSQKSARPGNASYYYSITRLATAGKLRIGGRVFSVSGLSWLDREWSTSALAADQAGWDWFALQLGDGGDLMFYQLRSQDGGRDSSSAGTYTDADGVATHLDDGDVEIVVLEHWRSPDGGTYPAQWLLQVPRLGLRLMIRPVIANQELVTTVRYWEGAVDVTGTRRAMPVKGHGYVELTGYAGD